MDSTTWHWQLRGHDTIEPDGSYAWLVAPDMDRNDAGKIAMIVRVKQDDLEIAVSVRVTLEEAPQIAARVEGIPEPVPITAPGESWRSRLRGGQWVDNDAHPDYLTVADIEAQRLCYMVNLFAKEIVLKNFGTPGADAVLERMIELLTSIDAGRRI